jgi:PadR family transcriptional regulator, regulatory protein PadR
MVTQDRTATSVENLTQELRRGILALAVLAQCHEPQYGYSLKQHLAEHGLDVNEGTLYPLLRRLEEQGLLDSEWRIAGESRPRRYYRINDAGRAALERLAREWQSLETALGRLLASTAPTRRQ